jgi:hypothetical protein
MSAKQEFESYIFFLQAKPQLPEAFFLLSTLFADFGISLIPVTPSSLKDLSYNERRHLIVLRNDLESNECFQKARKVHIDYLMKHLLINLYDLTSFGEIEQTARVKRYRCYHSFALPASFEEIIVKISYEYYKSQKGNHKWPGGRKGKFPEMNG